MCTQVISDLTSAYLQDGQIDREGGTKGKGKEQDNEVALQSKCSGGPRSVCVYVCVL